MLYMYIYIHYSASITPLAVMNYGIVRSFNEGV